MKKLVILTTLLLTSITFYQINSMDIPANSTTIETRPRTTVAVYVFCNSKILLKQQKFANTIYWVLPTRDMKFKEL